MVAYERSDLVNLIMLERWGACVVGVGIVDVVDVSGVEIRLVWGGGMVMQGMHYHLENHLVNSAVLVL